MARATWRGYLALGQLGIPVRLYSGTRQAGPHTILLHEKDGSPVERITRCKQEMRDIPSSETIRAVEHEPGHYVTLTDQELEREVTGPIRTVNLERFCDTGALDSVFYDKPYYVAAAKGGERAYALLREVLDRTRKAAISRYYLYRREHIGLLMTQGDMLILQQLRYASEIEPRSNIKTPALPKPSPSEIDTLSAVVERFSGPLYIEDYHNVYAERIEELVAQKARGLKPPKRKSLPPGAATPDEDLDSILRNMLESPADIAASAS